MKINMKAGKSRLVHVSYCGFNFRFLFSSLLFVAKVLAVITGCCGQIEIFYVKTLRLDGYLLLLCILVL